MSVVKRPGRSSVAFVVALTLLLAFVVPFVGTALAGHNTNHDLDCNPETDQNPTGTEHEITCTVSGDPQTNVEVDFEVTGANDPDDSDSPNTPDFTCNTGGGNTCTMDGWGDNAAETSETGTSTIRAWIDDTQNNEGPTDTTETQDETTTPGSGTEPDDTDVVTKTWFAAFPADATLDCTPETATNPATGPDSSETYTCTLYNDADNDDVQDQGEGPISGIRLDAEVGGDPNDPDNGTGTTADYNDACTTDSSGQCQVTIPASEAQAGTTEICIWADPDADNQYSAGGDPNDGGQCDTETDEDANQTDIVEKTWVAPGTARSLDAEPESDQNQEGTAHTVTATVTDINDAPVQGVGVDFIAAGGSRNAGMLCDQVITNSSGTATCTYTDVGTAVGPGFATDNIDVCVDAGDDDNCDDGTEGPDDDPANENLTDRVQKFWFDQIPQAAQVVVDMNGCNGETDNDASATNSVGVAHEVCISVFDNATTNTPLPGETVTVDLTGVGTFVTPEVFSDRDNITDGVDGDEDLGDQVTVVTNEAGQAFVYVYSEESGNSNVTASADGQTDSGTKTWQAETARNIDCSPDSATNLINTSHTVACEVVDQFGNPVPGEIVNARESGPGNITTTDDPDDVCDDFYGDNNAACIAQITDNSGTVEFVVESSTEGTQTIDVALEDDSEFNDGDEGGAPGDDNDECDQLAGRSSVDDDNNKHNPFEDDTRADAAGNCNETVTKTWATTITPAEGFPRQVTLEASKNKVRYGKTFELTATVQPGDQSTPPSCVQNVTVEFERTVVGDTGTESVGTAVTNAEGIASLQVTADRNANYVAHLDQVGECSEANSTAEPVLVKKQVKLKISDQTPRRGERVRFKVKILPCGGPDGAGHEGHRAQLYKTVGGVLAKVAAKRTNDNCVAVFKRRVRKDASFQGRSPKQDADHQGGKSRAKAVQPHR